MMSAQQSHAMRNGLRRQFNFIQIICVIVSGIQYAEESSQNENEIFVHATEPGKRSCSRVTRDPRGARLRYEMLLFKFLVVVERVNSCYL
jgi:hypothetical protein